jgi:hypothetical protein
MTATQFLDLLRRSQLIDDDGLRECLSLPGDAEQIAAAMVEAGLLTKWQAEKLLAGKFKGFRLGDYVLLRHLRKTEVGQDYVAEHRLMRRKVVLAVAPPSRVTDSTYLDRLRAEAGIGELHQVGGVYYTIKPYIEGLDDGA